MVFISLTVVITVALLTIVVLLYYRAWRRGLTIVANKMWGEIDIYEDNELPPKWRRVIAKYALYLRDFDVMWLKKHDELVQKMKDK